MVNALWRFAGVVCFVLESHEALPGQNLGDRRKEMSGIGTLEGVNLNDLPQRRALILLTIVAATPSQADKPLEAQGTRKLEISARQREGNPIRGARAGDGKSMKAGIE